MFQCLNPLLGALIGRRTLSLVLSQKRAHQGSLFSLFCIAQNTGTMLQCTKSLVNPPDDPHWSEDPWYSFWGFFVSHLSPYWSLIFSVDPIKSVLIPHQSSLIWHLSISCQSNDYAWLPYSVLHINTEPLSWAWFWSQTPQIKFLIVNMGLISVNLHFKNMPLIT